MITLSELWYGFERHDDDFRVVRLALGLKWFSKLFHVVTIFLINQTLMVWSYAWYVCWFHSHSLTQIFHMFSSFSYQGKPSYHPTQTYPATRIHQKPWCCQVWRQCKRPNKQLLKRPRRKKSKSLPSEKLRDAGEMELGVNCFKKSPAFNPDLLPNHSQRWKLSSHNVQPPPTKTTTPPEN